MWGGNENVVGVMFDGKTEVKGVIIGDVRRKNGPFEPLCGIVGRKKGLFKRVKFDGSRGEAARKPGDSGRKEP